VEFTSVTTSLYLLKASRPVFSFLLVQNPSGYHPESCNDLEPKGTTTLHYVLVCAIGIVHESTNDSNYMRYVWPRCDHSVHQWANSPCVWYRFHMVPLWIGCRQSFHDSQGLADNSVVADRAECMLNRSKIRQMEWAWDKYNCRECRFRVIFILRIWCVRLRSFIANFSSICRQSSTSSPICRSESSISST
jgi:hypothetical protein